MRSGKALYAGISNYPVELDAPRLSWKALGTPCLRFTSPNIRALERWVEKRALLDTVEQEGTGVIAFAAGTGLAYRPVPGWHPRGFACGQVVFLKPEQVAPAIAKAKKLNEVVLAAQAVVGGDGYRLAAERQTGYFGADWRQLDWSVKKQPGVAAKLLCP